MIPDVDAHLNKLLKVQPTYNHLYPSTVIVIVVGTLILIGANTIPDFFNSIFIEVISVVVTVGIIDRLNRNRDKQAQDEIQRVLSANYGQVTSMPESHKHFLEMVVRQLFTGHETKWFDLSGYMGHSIKINHATLSLFTIFDTTWKLSDFSHTCFKYCDLRESNFSDCRFVGSYFSKCRLGDLHAGTIPSDFADVSFRDSVFEDSHMRSCRFNRVSFRDAKITNCSLVGSILNATDLQGADFTGSDLEGVHIGIVQCDSTTILPDGSCYIPSAGLAQWERFTKSAHPQFQKYDVGQPMIPSEMPDIMKQTLNI
jgi:hypothetical protein